MLDPAIDDSLMSSACQLKGLQHRRGRDEHGGRSSRVNLPATPWTLKREPHTKGGAHDN